MTPTRIELVFSPGGSKAASHPGGAVQVVQSVITVDALIDFTYGLAAPYRQNATWVMSSLTAAVLAKMKDADGNLIWRESLIAGQPSTLLCRPVEIDEAMPAPVANALVIEFGDFKAGYLINDRIGTRVLRDPFTSNPTYCFTSPSALAAACSTRTRCGYLSFRRNLIIRPPGPIGLRRQ